jgi:hypothetical protein
VRAVAGVWTHEADKGITVVTHDGSKWPGTPGYPLALFEEPGEFSQGTASIEFKLIGGSDDYPAGLAFGHTGQSYFYVRYNTKDGNVALWRMDGPERTRIKAGEAEEQLEKGVWHRLDLIVDGATVRARVGERLSVEHTLDAPPAGKLGLWTKPDATTAFRNLRVRN